MRLDLSADRTVRPISGGSHLSDDAASTEVVATSALTAGWSSLWRRRWADMFGGPPRARMDSPSWKEALTQATCKYDGVSDALRLAWSDTVLLD